MAFGLIVCNWGNTGDGLVIATSAENSATLFSYLK